MQDIDEWPTNLKLTVVEWIVYLVLAKGKNGFNEKNVIIWKSHLIKRRSIWRWLKWRHGISVVSLVSFYSLLSQEQKITGIEIILIFSWKGESTVLQGEENPVDSSGFQEQDVKEVGDELDDGTEETAKPLLKIAHFP